MKKLLALLLALVMCFTLAACGENEDDAPSKGEKLYQKYKEIINFLEDGEFDQAYDALVNLAGEEFNGDDKVDLGELQDIFDALTKGDYAGAIEDIIELENSKNQGAPTDMTALLCNTWYGANFEGEEFPEQTLISFAADGNCDILGRQLKWVIEDQWDNQLRLDLYDGSTEIYSANLRILENGLALVSVYDSVNNGRGIGSFYLDPLMIFALGTWNALDQTEQTLHNYFYIDGTEAQIDGTYYDWKQTSETGAQELTMEFYEKGTTEVTHTLRFWQRDGRYVCQLTGADGATSLYYSDRNGGYSKDWPEYMYNCAVKAIDALQSGSSSIWIGDEWLSGQDAWAMIYHLLNNCDGYKNSDSMIGNFILVHNKLSSSVIHSTDNLGNTGKFTYETNVYDAQGQLVQSNRVELEMFLFGTYEYNTYNFYMEYDENGKLTQILCGWSKTDVRAIFTPTYDADGNIISMEKRTNDGVTTSYYTYENGRLIRAEFNRSASGDPTYYIDYHYNALGMLEKVDGIFYAHNSYEFDICYTYAGNGNIQNKTINIYKSRVSSWQTDWFLSFDYTCDVEGNPTQATVTGTDYTNYASVTMENDYGILYFYQN